MKNQKFKKLSQLKVRKYSGIKDFAELIILFAALAFIFYRFIYLPVFGKSSFYEGIIKCRYEIEQTSSKTANYEMTVETDGENVIIERKGDESTEKLMLSGKEFFQIKDEKAYLLERSLNPFYLPFSPSFGAFLLEHSHFLKDFSDKGKISYAGRECKRVIFGDWLLPDRRYEVIIDEQTGMPLFIRAAGSKGTVMRARALSIEFAKGKLSDKDAPDKYQDLYRLKRLEPGEVSTVANFEVLPPGYIPVELKNSQILYLNEYTPPLSPLKFSGRLVLFNYFGSERFVNIIQYRGDFPLVVKNGVGKIKAANRVFNIIACPGYFTAWKTEDGVSVVIIANLPEKEIIKIIKGLYE